MCMCILYMCTCVSRLSMFLCVYSIVYLRRGRGKKGRGGVVWRWRSGREGVFFRPEYLPYKVWGSNVRKGRGQGLNESTFMLSCYDMNSERVILALMCA